MQPQATVQQRIFAFARQLGTKLVHDSLIAARRDFATEAGAVTIDIGVAVDGEG